MCMRALRISVGAAVAAASFFGWAADLKRAEEIVTSNCSICHGTQGESSTQLYPKLAGQDGDYIARQLADFKSGKRKADAMKDMVANLTPEEMKALGTYFENKKSHPHAPSDRELVAVGRYIYNKGNPYSGVASCTNCHGASGNGTAHLARLAGQQPLYTETQIKQFNKRERTNDNAVMHSIAAKLTELEVKALAEYIGSME